jgi:hypothetical protein
MPINDLISPDELSQLIKCSDALDTYESLISQAAGWETLPIIFQKHHHSLIIASEWLKLKAFLGRLSAGC